jgi:hypothetical protein
MTFPKLKLLFIALVFATLCSIQFSVALRAETMQAPSDTSAAGELAFWNSIKTSDNPADFEVYLQTFPDGMFLDVANARYQALGGTVEAVDTPEPPKKLKQAPQVKKLVYKPPTRKYAKSIFSKPKKVKQAVVYRKSYVKVRKPKVIRAAVIQYRKPKPVKYVKIKTYKARPAYKPKKIYTKPAIDSNYGSGGGGGGDGGGGGGWGG